MTESSKVDGPAPMEGHGAYNRSSRVQAAGSSTAVRCLREQPEKLICRFRRTSGGNKSLEDVPAKQAAVRPRLIPAQIPNDSVNADLIWLSCSVRAREGLPGKNRVIVWRGKPAAGQSNVLEALFAASRRLHRVAYRSQNLCCPHSTVFGEPPNLIKCTRRKK